MQDSSKSRGRPHLVGSLLLVALGGGVVGRLLGLVLHGIDTGLGAVANTNVGVLGDVLVGLLGSLVGSSLDLVCKVKQLVSIR